MTRFGHLADIHAGHRQYGVKAREEDMTLSFFQALKEQAEAGAEAILLPGDLFDDRDLRPEVLAEVEAALREGAADVPVIVTRGNHDENLTPRDFTWLEYLDQKGLITLLEANLNPSTPVEMFPASPESESPAVSVDDGRHNQPGYIDLQTEGDRGPIRVFGLQYRGGYIDTALEQAGEAVTEINEQAPTPAMTVLMAHFGLADEVPDLGARVSDTALNPVREAIDYLALGHIHKQYERNWAFNPGSIEAHDAREAQWEGHGYYLVDVGDAVGESIDDPTNTTSADVPFRASHHLSKRRPFHRLTVDISEAGTFDGVEALFEEVIRDEADAIEETCQQEPFSRSNGQPRVPVLDVRLQGTLQFERRDLDTDQLTEIAEGIVDPLYVHLTDHTDTIAIQELMDGVDEDAVFDGDGTLNIEAVEEQVFETIVTESPYAEESAAVVSMLREVRKGMSDDDAENPVAGVVDMVTETRRAAFPDGVDADLEVDLDITVPTSPVEEARGDVEIDQASDEETAPEGVGTDHDRGESEELAAGDSTPETDSGDPSAPHEHDDQPADPEEETNSRESTRTLEDF
jgi:exonuclease SbcD